MPPKTKKYCCICSNFRGKVVDSKVVTLHRFPANIKIRRIWIQRCKLVMKTFNHTKNSLLCSDHFLDRTGPSPMHPIPSLFGTKTFKTSTVDENQDAEVGMLDLDQSTPDIEVNTCDISIGSDDSERSAHGFTTSESILDTSLRVHDYLGAPNLDNRSVFRHQFSQTLPTTRTIGIQTQSDPLVKCIDVGCQTDSTTFVDNGVQVCLPTLTYEDIKDDDQKVLFYTGIPDGDTFNLLFDSLKDDAVKGTCRDESVVTRSNSGGRPRILRLIDEFFMVLMRLRLGLLLEDLAFRFCVSSSTCGLIFNKWIDFLDWKLDFLVVWPSREAIDSNMPQVFREKFPSTRVIIDATEIRTETPSSLQLKSLMYSDYKSHMTWKSLVGISPAGTVTYVSDLWCGSISDKQLTIESEIVKKCKSGDAIMADKGFTISDLTTPWDVELIIPPFKRKKKQFSRRDVKKTRDIANARIHVERQMERIKNFRIVQGVMPITMAKRASKVWKLCAKLTNLLPPLVPEHMH